MMMASLNQPHSFEQLMGNRNPLLPAEEQIRVLKDALSRAEEEKSDAVWENYRLKDELHEAKEEIYRLRLDNEYKTLALRMLVPCDENGILLDVLPVKEKSPSVAERAKDLLNGIIDSLKKPEIGAYAAEFEQRRMDGPAKIRRLADGLRLL